MVVKYVCNPKTNRVIKVGGATYKQVSKNAAAKKKLMLLPKSSSKKKLTPCKSPRRRTKSPKRKKRAPSLRKYKNNDDGNWAHFHSLVKKERKEKIRKLKLEQQEQQWRNQQKQQLVPSVDAKKDQQ